MPLHILITSVYHLIYQVEGEEIEVELVGSPVWLTSDIWTNAATQGYIDWKLCSWLLLTREMRNATLVLISLKGY